MNLSKQSHYFPEVVQILDITPNSPKMSVGSGFFIEPHNKKESLLPVSYTHLTLPTNREV